VRPAIRVAVAAITALVLPHGAARADETTAFLTFAWESFWQQSGYPRAIAKWREPIRVKFTGASADRFKPFAMRELMEVAQVAGIAISEVASNDENVNLQVEFIGSPDALPENQPCQTRITVRGGAIQRVHIQANEPAVWRCMMHEAMHAMGIPGHPVANSVLTYFARSGRLTDIDKRLLRLIYSDALQPDMSPFAALAVIARRPAGDAGNAADGITSLLRKIISDMERFADGTGEPPAVILRSSKATASGIERGQRDVQYFLGIAYLQGHIVDRDRAKAIDWLSKAAAASHLQARRLLDRLNSQAVRPAAEIAITH
jgi:hypothetical protein